MNKSVFLKLFGLAMVFTLIPFFGGLAIGKAVELATETPQNSPTISALAYTQPESVLEEVANTEPAPVTDSVATTSEPIQDNKPSHNSTPATPKVAGVSANPAPPKVVASSSCQGNLSQSFLCLLNQYRAEKGLGKISYNSQLSTAALNHSSWMNTTGIFSHTGLNGSRMTDRCVAVGTTCLAENLAENILDAQKLLNSWKANPGHNKNLLGPYTIAGFGLSGPYVTLVFN